MGKKHHIRDSIKSFLGSHIDPEREEQLKGTKTDVEDKVKTMLTLVWKENPDEEDDVDGEDIVRLGNSRRESLARMIEDFHQKYQSLYEQYDYLTAKLKEKAHVRRGQDAAASSISDSDSDDSSEGKNGRLYANSEVDELKRELSDVIGEKAALESEYKTALSKIEGFEENVQELNAKVSLLTAENSKGLVENKKLINQLEDLTRQKESLSQEKEAALRRIQDEEKASGNLKVLLDGLREEKAAFGLELESVKGKATSIANQKEAAEQTIAELRSNLKTAEGEKKSLTSKVSERLSQIEESQRMMEEVSSESERLKQNLVEKESEFAAVVEAHEVHKESVSQEREGLKAQIESLRSELESLRNEKGTVEEKFASGANEIERLTGENAGLKEKAAECEKMLKDKEEESLTRIEDLKAQVDSLQLNLSAWEDMKVELERLKQNLVEKEREFAAAVEAHEVHKESMSQVREDLKAQIESLGSELESLRYEKGTVEEKFASGANEIERLTGENAGLKEKAAECEKMLKDKEEESLMRIEDLKAQVDSLQLYLSAWEDMKVELEQVKQNLVEKEREFAAVVEAHEVHKESVSQEREGQKAQIESLGSELASLRNEKGTVEEKFASGANEIERLTGENAGLKEKAAECEKMLKDKEEESLTRIEDLKAQVDSLQLNLSACEDMKVELERLKQNLVEKEREFAAVVEAHEVHKESVSQVREGLKAQIESLGSELELLRYEKGTVEEKFASGANEIECLSGENAGLKEKAAECEKMLKDKEEESLTRIEDLKTQVDSLQLYLSAWEDTKVELERLKQNMGDKEREFTAVVEAHEVHKERVSQEREGLKAQIESLGSELESLRDEKGTVEEKFVSGANEIERLTGENAGLKERAAECEMLKDKEEESLTRIEDLNAQVDSLQLNLSALEDMKVELERLKQNLVEKEREFAAVVEAHDVHKESVSHEREGLKAQIESLGSELESLRNEKGTVEEKFASGANEIERLTGENAGLKEKAAECEKMLKDKEEESLTRIEDLKAQVDSLQLNLSALEDMKVELEGQIALRSDKASAQLNKLTDQLTESTLELESLRNHKVELETLLEEKSEEKGSLEAALRHLEMEADNVRNEKMSLAEQLQTLNDSHDLLREEHGGLQANVRELQENLDSSEGYKADLALQIESRSRDLSDLSVQIENFKQQLVTGSEHHRELSEEKDGMKARINELMVEAESLVNQRGTLEEEMQTKCREAEQLQYQNKTLQDEVLHLEKELSVVRGDLAAASARIVELEMQINNLKQEMESRESEKSELELQLERERRESSERLMLIENEKSEAANQIEHHQNILKQREIEHGKLTEEFNLTEGLFRQEKESREHAECRIQEIESELRTKINLRDQSVADLEEMVEDLKRELELKGDEISSLTENVSLIEVKHRLSNQKLRVTEQLLSEREESFRIAEAKYQQEQGALEEKIAALSGTLVTYRNAVTNISEELNSRYAELAVLKTKFETEHGNYSNRVSDVNRKLQVAKERATEANDEKHRLEVELSHLAGQLKCEEEQGLALRDRVEKLEAKVGEEEAAKNRLSTALYTIEKKAGEFEEKLKEKDEGIHDLGEEKKEAIRQLCIWIDYHRSRYDDIKDVLTKSRGVRAQRARSS